MRAYYDRIAKKWHSVTGAQGGALKKLVLNDFVLGKLPSIAGLSILELGAGNGYFLPLMLRRFSGQVPLRVVIADQSRVLIDLAQRLFRVADAEYRVLDVHNRQAGDIPIALLLECEKVVSSQMPTGDCNGSKVEAEPTATPDRGRSPGSAR